jgi:hypothetical protein
MPRNRGARRGLVHDVENSCARESKGPGDSLGRLPRGVARCGRALSSSPYAHTANQRSRQWCAADGRDGGVGV